MNDLRYVFFGTPRFAAIILEHLINAGYPPHALVANPDRPVGKKKIITPPPTKELLVRRGVQAAIFQPENVRTIEQELRVLSPDFFIVAAYAQIIPQNIIAIPRLGVVGVHPSLLPHYRGASPIQSVLLAGDNETGVTLYQIDTKMDHGGIISKAKFQISNLDTYESLMEKLVVSAADLLIETLPKFVKGEIAPRPQNEAEATYTKKFVTADAFIPPADLTIAVKGENPEKSREVLRKIRALNPEPGVWTTVQGKRVKLLEAKLKENRLELVTIQIDGRKAVAYTNIKNRLFDF